MKTVCVLRSADKDRQSRNSFQWPATGAVECSDWDPKPECGHGLHGLLWGIGDWSLCRCSDKDAVWQVVEVEESLLVSLNGKVKFPRGIVIYSGTLAGALTLTMARHFEEILKPATSGSRSPAATSGSRSPAATSGDAAPAATSGSRSPAACLGMNSRAKTGPEGSIVLTYKDVADRTRHVIGYVGEGIEAHVWYEVSNGQLAKCAAQNVLTAEGFVR